MDTQTYVRPASFYTLWSEVYIIGIFQLLLNVACLAAGGCSQSNLISDFPKAIPSHLSLRNRQTFVHFITLLYYDTLLSSLQRREKKKNNNW